VVFFVCVVYKLLCFMITTTQTLAIVFYFVSSNALQLIFLYDYFYVWGCLQDKLCHLNYYFFKIVMMWVGFLLSILWCKC
jgi:hypothetical protein